MSKRMEVCTDQQESENWMRLNRSVIGETKMN